MVSGQRAEQVLDGHWWERLSFNLQDIEAVGCEEP
jgi:hypothetical protein